MTKLQHNQRGYGASRSLALIAIFALALLAGRVLYNHYHRAISSSSATQSQAGPYTGWISASSPRARFSVKYPAGWAYSAVVGSKDSVEHITITGPKLQLKVDSYSGRDPASGGVAATGCGDCHDAIASQAFTASGIGVLHLDTVTYRLDNGFGNALVLRQADGTYYIPSPAVQGVYTSFRAISRLGSVPAYQAETPGQFQANPDYTKARQILKSIAY